MLNWDTTANVFVAVKIYTKNNSQIKMRKKISDELMTSESGTAHPSGAPESPPVFSRVPVTQSLVLCVMVGRSLFVLLSFLIWPLCCLSFFDLRILITPLVSLNFP